MGGSYSVPEQFYYAAKEGSAQKLRQLEQRHAPDVAWTNLDGSSAVHMAAASLDLARSSAGQVLKCVHIGEPMRRIGCCSRCIRRAFSRFSFLLKSQG